MWQKRETKVIEVAGSQSGFPKKPFSPCIPTQMSKFFYKVKKLCFLDKGG